jgi:hypothetical protein
MTTETKFTQGKWSQSHRKQSDGMYITQVYDDRGQSICDLAWHSVDMGDGMVKTDRSENAKLIAVAPEMYGLLEDIVDDMERGSFCGNSNFAKVIRDLLAKARGEL